VQWLKAMLQGESPGGSAASLNMDRTLSRDGPRVGARILLVEDDDTTRSFLSENLRADGYEIAEAADAGAGEHELERSSPDLAIVDLGLPDRDGLRLIESVRASDRVASQIDPELPIVVLSGRGSELDRIRGFDHGCDEYVVKPFSYLELRARIAAVLRRADCRPVGGRMRIGPLEIDRLSRRVWLHGCEVALSSKEFGLLVTLAGDPLRVFTREELLRIVWAYQSLGATRTLDTHASRLRRKLAVGGAVFVINVWGVGYRLLEG
jgi:DNA-binding response OmpR family regulator